MKTWKGLNTVNKPKHDSDNGMGTDIKYKVYLRYVDSLTEGLWNKRRSIRYSNQRTGQRYPICNNE